MLVEETRSHSEGREWTSLSPSDHPVGSPKGSRRCVGGGHPSAQRADQGDWRRAWDRKIATTCRRYEPTSRFAVSSTLRDLTPVALPPGRLRLATRPSATGSEPVPKTIGMLEVAALAATAPAVLTGTAITATCRRTRSAANSGIRSSPPPAQRNSIATLRPSTYPVSLKPLRNASRCLTLTCAEVEPRKPITGIAGCCARAR